ncbi:hypothetical protein [Arsenophonus sp. PmNCSU2021_1]|uniref:hypothetical protein n=1 Tax=Arsenophonus sp. PmNCSU2021_1 TaxID=3118989 RepID=UPI002FEFCC2B
MSYFGLDPVVDNQLLDDAIHSTTHHQPGFFDAFLSLSVKGLYTALVAKPDQALWGLVDAVVSPVAQFVNDQFGIHDTSEAFIKEQRKLAEQQVRNLTPDPVTTGTAGQVLFSLFDIGSQAVVASMSGGTTAAALAVGGVQGFSEYEKLTAEGVNKSTAIDKATSDAIFTAGGLFLPMSLGLRGGGVLSEAVAAQLSSKGGMLGNIAASAAKATPDILFASSSNIAMGIAQRSFAAKMLKEGGYDEMASQYDILDKQAIAIDAVLGAAFGGMGRFINSRGENIKSPDFETIDVDSALTANQQVHIERDTTIGVPINAMSLNAHVAAMGKAMNDLSQGRSVDVGSLLDGAEFLSKPINRTFINSAVRDVLGIKEDVAIHANQTETFRVSDSAFDNAFDEKILSYISTPKPRDKVQIANDEMGTSFVQN